MEKHWTYILGGIGAILAIGAISSASGKSKKKKYKAIYYPGDRIEGWMSQLFTVRLPRGDYQVVADKIVMNTSIDLGNSTDVVILAEPAHAAYSERVKFVALGSGNEYIVDVAIDPLPAPATGAK